MEHQANQMKQGVPKLELERFIFTPPGPMGLGFEQFEQDANLAVSEHTTSILAAHLHQAGQLAELPVRRETGMAADVVPSEKEEELAEGRNETGAQVWIEPESLVETAVSKDEPSAESSKLPPVKPKRTYPQFYKCINGLCIPVPPRRRKR